MGTIPTCDRGIPYIAGNVFPEGTQEKSRLKFVSVMNIFKITGGKGKNERNPKYSKPGSQGDQLEAGRN
jgi:hypothetical protein